MARKCSICMTEMVPVDARGNRHGLTTWWPVSGAEIVRQFRRGMHERITDAVPYTARGRG